MVYSAAPSLAPSGRAICYNHIDSLPSSSQNYTENTNPCTQAHMENREGLKRPGLQERIYGTASGKGTGGVSDAKEKRSGLLSPWVNSSDEEPSPHSSIFEAPLVSDEEAEAVKEYVQGMRNRSPISVDGIDRGRVSGNQRPASTHTSRSRSRRSRRKLETISERNSAGNLCGTCISRRNSTSSADVALQADEEFQEEEEWLSLLSKGKRRRKSRSLGDNTDTEDGHAEGCFPQIYEYASPTMPIHPVMNTPTMPSEFPSPMLTPPLSVSYFNRNYGSSSPVRSSSLLAIAPAFRPPVSGYRSYGTITNHPFHHAPLAQACSFSGAGSFNRDVVGDRAGESGRATPDSLGNDTDSESFIGRRRSRVSTAGSYETSGWRFWLGTFCCCLRAERRGREVGD